MKIIQKIKRQENAFYTLLYKVGKNIRHVNIPDIPFIFVFLKYEQRFRKQFFGKLFAFLYYEPVFKTYCKECGKQLRLIGGIPLILGDLTIKIGTRVIIHGVTTFAAGKVYKETILEIGSNTHLGHQVDISVGSKVIIGDHVMISNRVSLVGYDFHPVDPDKRRKREAPGEEAADDIILEDNVWIGMNCIILKGTRIGENSIIGAGSLVKGDIPANCIAVGSPAKVVKKINVDN